MCIRDSFYLFGCVLVELRPEVCKKICSCCLYQVVTGWCNDCIRKGSRCDCQRYFLLEVRCITCSPVADNFDVVVIQKVSGVLVVIYGIAVRKCGILRVDLISIMYFYDMIKFCKRTIVIFTRYCIICFISCCNPVTRPCCIAGAAVR